MSQNKNRIMIVDKNGSAGYLLTNSLSKWGYEVVTVNSYLKAIEYAQHHSYLPELIIVELQDVNPIFFEFPRKFFERTNAKVPIVVYSVHNNVKDIKQSLESGYKDYLIRPMEPEILKDKILTFVKPDTNLNKDTFQFKINEEARMYSQIHIDLINEFGVEASVPFDILPGTIIYVQSPILNKNGINEIALRLIDSKLKPLNGDNKIYKYHARFAFAGLSENDVKKIRRIAIMHGQVAA